MAKLEDYSGEIKPKLDMSDFSSNFLVKLGRKWSFEQLFNVTQYFMEYLREKVGWEEAEQVQFDIALRMSRDLATKIAKLANIEVRTLVDALKVFQLYLEGAIIWGENCVHEIKSPNHIIWTIKQCPQVKIWEKANYSQEQVRGNCKKWESQYLQKVYLGILLPDVQVKPLKLPYQQEGISCQWEIWR